MASAGTGRKMSGRHRLAIVAGTRAASVVSSTQQVSGGGSSRIFSMASNPARLALCTSSSITTRCSPPVPYCRRSRSPRISSTDPLDAASISHTSREEPLALATDLQLGQTPQGQALPGASVTSQLSAAPKMRAVDVLPDPAGPVNSSPGGMFPRRAI